MFRFMTRSFWLILLIGLAVISTKCKSDPSPRVYQGTIYYGDNEGLWKMTLPDGKPSLLTSMLVIPGIGMSPDQKWLTYYSSTLKDNQKTHSSLWVVNTQGGDPIQVSREVPLVMPVRWKDGWLHYTELSDFQVDPNHASYAAPGHSETYAFNPETGERRLESESSPQSTFNSDVCQRRAFAPAKYGDVAERCVDTNGNGFLRVVKLDGSDPITIPVACGNEAVIWSGDGEWLAFGGNDSQGAAQVFIWGRRNESVKQITGRDVQEEFFFTAPSWSPDSRWLVFQTRRADLCVFEVDKDDLQCFEDYVSHYGAMPAWSPDSHAIILPSNRISELLMESKEQKKT